MDKYGVNPCVHVDSPVEGLCDAHGEGDGQPDPARADGRPLGHGQHGRQQHHQVAGQLGAEGEPPLAHGGGVLVPEVLLDQGGRLGEEPGDSRIRGFSNWIVFSSSHFFVSRTSVYIFRWIKSFFLILKGGYGLRRVKNNIFPITTTMVKKKKNNRFLFQRKEP